VDEASQQLGPDTSSGLNLPGVGTPQPAGGDAPSSARASVVPIGLPGAEEEGEGEDELLPAMADDDYSAQLSWQSQSKDNLKCVLLIILCRACRLK
jgi:transcription initiation factor TFIID subunit 11